MLGHLYFSFSKHKGKTLMLIVLTMAAYIPAWHAWKVRNQADRALAVEATPVEMTYSELVSAESLPQRYVEVTGCRVGTHMTAPLTKSGTPYVWVPLFPADAPEDETGKSVQLLARFRATEIPNIPDLLQQDRMRGVIWDDDALTPQALNQLLSHYPELNASNCYVLSTDDHSQDAKKLQFAESDQTAMAGMMGVILCLFLVYFGYSLREPKHVRLPKLTAAGSTSGKTSSRDRLLNTRLTELQQGEAVQCPNWSLSVDRLTWQKGPTKTPMSIELPEISSMKSDDSGLWLWKQRTVAPAAFFPKSAPDTLLLSQLLQKLLPDLGQQSVTTVAGWKERPIVSPQAHRRSAMAGDSTHNPEHFDPYKTVKSEDSVVIPGLPDDDPRREALGKFVFEFRQPNLLIGLFAFAAICGVLSTALPVLGVSLSDKMQIFIAVTVGVGVAGYVMEKLPWGQHRLCQFEQGLVLRRFGRNCVIPFTDLYGFSCRLENRTLNNQYIGTSYRLRFETKSGLVRRFSSYYHERSDLETDVEILFEECDAAVAENLRQLLKSNGAAPWTDRIVFYPDHLEISSLFSRTSVPYSDVHGLSFHEGELRLTYGSESHLVKLPPETCNASSGAQLLQLMRTTCC